MAVTEPSERTPDDVAKLRRLDEVAFHSTRSDASWQLAQELYREMPGLVVRDGEDVVAHAGYFRFRMSLPGATSRADGVSSVAVSPTHRRRGILTSLMRRQLDDLHADGSMLAALWASESAIYGRFGYGQASRLARATVPRAYRALRPVPGVEDMRLELHELAEVDGICREIYERAIPLRPAMIERSAALQAWVTHDEPGGRGRKSNLRAVVAFHVQSGAALGYAWFTVQPNWDSQGPKGTTSVREFVSLDPAATAALLQFVLDLDLTGDTRFGSLPVDHELFHLLVEPRRSAPLVADQLWVRLVNVGTALAARRYATEVTARIGVRDDFCRWNDGVWVLSGAPSHATCTKDSVAADVVLDVRDLAAVYLGDGSVGALARAGLVEERVPGVASMLTRAFAHDPLPWCSFIF